MKVLVSGVTVLLALSTTALRPAAAATSDPSLQQQQQQLRRVRAERAAQAAKLDVLKASDHQIQGAISDLQTNVADQQQAVSRAESRVASADAALTTAQQQQAAHEATLAAAQTTLKQVALKAYMSGPDSGGGLEIDATASASHLVFSRLLGVSAQTFRDATDRYDAALADVSASRRRAEVARTAAGQRRQEATTYLTQLTQALRHQQAVADQVEARLDAALAEADSLAATDLKLATGIRQQQAAIAAQVEAAQRASAAAARQAGIAAPAPAVFAGGGGGPPSGRIVSVNGIQVDSSIAGRLSAMIAAAAASGLRLGGGGYRSAAAQIAVRRANCGPTYYDIWQKPPSQCHPGAARPGTSMHEKGLAIDFTCNGVLISSHASPCFRWLAAHAASFGFFNIPSEAWHWSVNGH